MTEPDVSTGPVAFAASFPLEERFAATAGEIAGRLAAACGCTAAAADEVKASVSRTFGEALAAAAPSGAAIDVTLRAEASVFEADLACGGRRLLHCTKPRSA